MSVLFQYQTNETEFYDLVVCGGGPSGVAAAISAAREGLKVVIIERFGFLGGVATNSLVGVWLGSYSRDTEGSQSGLGGSAGKDSYPVVRGVFEEIVERLVNEGGAIPAKDDVLSGSRHLGYAQWHGRACAFEFETCKRILEQMVLESGAEIRYLNTIIGVNKKESKLGGVFVSSKSGIELVRGKAFIDATGDADIAFFSGCLTEKGREEDGLMQSATTIFLVDEVDSYAFEKYCKQTGDNRLREAIKRYKKEHEWPFSFDIIICCEMPRRGSFFINTLRQIGIDGINQASVTKGLIEGRHEAKQLFDIMKKIVPGFENSKMVQTGSMIGIRDTKRIIGRYKLTVQDIIDNKSFDDTIALSGYAWDMHNPKKPSEDSMHSTAISKPYVEIPYRCLLPLGVDNLIVAGRILSVEWKALGPVRVMPSCFAMGQAAGLASVEVISSDMPYSNVDIGILRQNLLKNGAILGSDK